VCRREVEEELEDALTLDCFLGGIVSSLDRKKKRLKKKARQNAQYLII
jgi:hypothetical protein